MMVMVTMTNMMVMMIMIANDDYGGGDGDHDYHDEARAILARCGASSVASAIYAANDLDGHTMMVMINDNNDNDDDDDDDDEDDDDDDCQLPRWVMASNPNTSLSASFES